MQPPEEITVHSCKHDGRVNRIWTARVTRREGSLIAIDGAFTEEVRHPLIGTIEAGTLSTEFFWTDRWYSVFRFHSPKGCLLKFYCNINTPARLDAGILSFIDLDVDLLVNPDYSYTVLDEDEFKQHADIYDYPPLYRARVREALDDLFHLIENRQFPFYFNYHSSTVIDDKVHPEEKLL
jgi:protein associated with RNAse G/E